MMHRVNIVVLFTAALLLGCGDDDFDPGMDAGPPPDTGPEPCTIPDLACPEDQPYSGSACATTETCTYADPIAMGGTPITWTYTCTGGKWAGTSDCKPAPGGACPVGPLAESCRTPFTGSLAGATVEIGPPGAEAFRPFLPMEDAALIVGGQGSPMISYRIRVTGDGVPSCVSTTTTLTMNGMAQAPFTQPAVLHCGESLSILTVIPDNCDPTPVPLTIAIELEGIGTGTANLMVMPGCLDGAL